MQTTYEAFRAQYIKTENPFNQGVIKNLKEIFISKIPPSLIDFRSIVKEDEPTETNTATSKEIVSIEMGEMLDHRRKSCAGARNTLRDVMAREPVTSANTLRNIMDREIDMSQRQREHEPERKDQIEIDVNYCEIESNVEEKNVNDDDTAQKVDRFL